MGIVTTGPFPTLGAKLSLSRQPIAFTYAAQAHMTHCRFQSELHLENTNTESTRIISTTALKRCPPLPLSSHFPIKRASYGSFRGAASQYHPTTLWMLFTGFERQGANYRSATFSPNVWHFLQKHPQSGQHISDYWPAWVKTRRADTKADKTRIRNVENKCFVMMG